MKADTYRRSVLVVLSLLGLLLYAKTLPYDQFVFDGHLYLKENPLIRDFRYFVQLLDPWSFAQLDEKLGLNRDVITNFMLRPVSYLSFAINYMISSYDPASLRSVNIAIHILNTLLVYAILEWITQSSPKSGSLDRYSARFIPTATATIFLLHPMQTESVTYIAQRFTSMAALFYLLTLWLYLKSATTREYRKKIALRVLSVIVLLFGMLVKESVFTAPLMIVLLEVIICATPFPLALKRAWPHLCLLPLIPVLVLLTSAAQATSPISLHNALQIVNYENYSTYRYAVTQLYIVMTYLRLYLLPYGQNVDPDYPLLSSFFQAQACLSAAAIAIIVTAALIQYRRNEHDLRSSLIFFGIGWYFLEIAVTSSIVPLPDLMAEHRPYLAAVGFLFAVVTIVDWVRVKGSQRLKRPVAVATAVWCVILGLCTDARNEVWQSPIRLWSDAVEKSPLKDRPWYNLGLALNEAGRYSQAIDCFNRAIALNPGWSKCYEGLTVAYLNQNNYPMAVDSGLRGIQLDGSNAVIHNNLGIAYAQSGQYDQARKAFKRALTLRSEYQIARFNLEKLEAATNNVAPSSADQVALLALTENTAARPAREFTLPHQYPPSRIVQP